LQADRIWRTYLARRGQQPQQSTPVVVTHG